MRCVFDILRFRTVLSTSAGPSYVLKNWPEGYCMFDHHKGPHATPRHDIYFFGE